MSSNRGLKPHITHWLGCGCLRLSSGGYRLDPGCGFPHMDVVGMGLRGPGGAMVSYACGCLGYCRCGQEEQLRAADRSIHRWMKDATDPGFDRG